MAKKTSGTIDLDKLTSGFSSALESAAQVLRSGEKEDIVGRRVRWCDEFADNIARGGHTGEVLSRLTVMPIETGRILELAQAASRKSQLAAVVAYHSEQAQPELAA